MMNTEKGLWYHKRMNKKEYDINYVKLNIKRVPLNLNKLHDQDIIKHLENKNANAYIKELIRKDIKERKK